MQQPIAVAGQSPMSEIAPDAHDDVPIALRRDRAKKGSSRVMVPSAGPEDWRRLTAKPDLHWKKGYSARTLAYAWEAAAGFPPEVAAILDATYGPTALVLAIPEHKTPLPGGARESQSDVLAIGRHGAGLVACAIEGKVEEPFGPTVEEWNVAPSPGKMERLAYILALLGLKECPGWVHYQLLHRTASALIEAHRFAASDAAMIVHSFSPDARWADAFTGFVTLFGQHAGSGGHAVITVPSGQRLCLGWACGDPQFLET